MADHLVKTNKERYLPRKEAAYLYWKEQNPTGTALAGNFGVGLSTACRWIREWKARPAPLAQ